MILLMDQMCFAKAKSLLSKLPESQRATFLEAGGMEAAGLLEQAEGQGPLPTIPQLRGVDSKGKGTPGILTPVSKNSGAWK